MTDAAGSGRYDRLAILRGAAYGNLLALPGALANSALSGRDDVSDGLVALTFLVVVLGFLVAGIAAGANAPSEPARHGAIAGLVAFVPVELIAIAGRLDRGDPVRPVGIVLLALLAACVGTAGAQIGARRRASRSVATSPPEGS
ncbi:MAG: TIGR04086 family membrane protein [Acidimicrobiales bacterium]|nr:TIGR04086 family membrane protein [Acidimicrobiales bacterium]HRW37696.1 TIGR04086 family membrane protein [Aquihabitans sp.]